MAVIINELEVIVENPRSPKEPTEPEKPELPRLKPLDLREIAERERYLRLRTFAH